MGSAYGRPLARVVEAGDGYGANMRLGLVTSADSTTPRTPAISPPHAQLAVTGRSA